LVCTLKCNTSSVTINRMRYRHISKVERLELSILRTKGYSIREIAASFGRSPASVSRELRRNEVQRVYDPMKANHKAYVKRKYSKYQAMKIREYPILEQYIQNCLVAGWTPEEISERLASEGAKIRVSFKTIYQYLDTAVGERYRVFLPSHVWGRRKRTRRVLIPDRIFIEARPHQARDRSEVGHFEGDLLGVPRTSSRTLAAVVDRKSRYLIAEKIRRRDAIMSYGRMLKGEPVHTLTLDNDVAHVHHRELSTATYFCHPYRSWEKPTVENTFQRLRRWIPKHANIQGYSIPSIRAIIQRMNRTPRKCLGWRMPIEVFKGLSIQTFPKECCT